MTAWNSDALSRAHYAVGALRADVVEVAGAELDALFAQLLDAIDQADERVGQAA